MLQYKVAILQAVIDSCLVQVIVHKVERGPMFFFSRLFALQKSSGLHKLIIGLSHLYQYIQIPTFRMKSASGVTRTVISPLWEVSLELKDAYFHNPVRWQLQKVLTFPRRAEIIVFHFLSFGLSVAARSFTRLIKPIKALLHASQDRLHSYMDDFLILYEDPELVVLQL